jgi:hypothetical protein
MDSDDEPRVWDLLATERVTQAWGLPPRDSWFSRCSPFKGVKITEPAARGNPVTLEKYLQIAE